MVLSVVVGLRKMSISKLDGFRIIRSRKLIFVWGDELYVCVYLVYILQLIAQNNNFPQKLIQNLNLQIKHKKPTRIKPT